MLATSLALCPIFNMWKNTLLAVLITSSFAANSAYAVYPYKKKKPQIPAVFKDREEAKAWVKKLEVASTQKSKVDHLKTLKANHPRLIVSTDELTRIKTKIKSDKIAQKILRKLKRKADRYLKEPPFKFNKAGDGNYLESSRYALKRISTLAGLYRVLGDKRYLNRAKKDMARIATYKDWNAAHFLDVAEMTCAMAIGYDWLYDELSIQERKTIKTAIIESGIKPGLNQYKIHKWWTYSPYNWNIVCNGGLIVGALAIASEEPELANQVINCAKLSVPYGMSTFYPDGGWPEGPSYWCYCNRYAMFMLSSLDSALGNDFGWSKSPGYSKTGFFRIHVTSPTGRYFNFADSKSRPRKAPQMFWMAKKFNQPVYAYAEMETAKSVTDIFHLLFYPEKTESFKDNKLNTVARFRGTNAGFYRSSWNDKKALYLAFKGGSNQVGHAHLDLGTFVLDWFGKRWATELGPDNYSLPGYFDGKRWSYLRLKTKGQNCFTIDGINQNLEGRAPLKIIREKPNFKASIDLSNAYRAQVNSAKRSFIVKKKNQQNSVIVKDKIALKMPAKVAWHMYTRANVRIVDKGKKAILSYPDTKENLVFHLDEPKGAKFSVSNPVLKKPHRPITGVRHLKAELAEAGLDINFKIRIVPIAW